MLEKFVCAIAMALCQWLDNRHNATDGTGGDTGSRRAGTRLREWLQQSGTRK
jgi:hypothetical protein